MGNYQPNKAIVIYKKDYTETYCEVHEIKKGEFGPGRPLKVEELEEISNLTKSKDQISSNECFPMRNILAFDLNNSRKKIMWISPARKVKLVFSKRIKEIKTGEFYIPNIIFKLHGKKLNVYAIKNKDVSKINPNIKLFMAPFMNVNENGSVCMGSSKIKDSKSLNDLIKSAEDVFFKSEFNAFHVNKVVNGNYMQIMNSQKNKFEEKHLVKSKLELSDIW